ncbi:B12-dependent methionine synthase [Gimesia maris DSM 8797]|nr:B12-dependent methionine synthase [Gimesia maris DSM 8797]
MPAVTVSWWSELVSSLCLTARRVCSFVLNASCVVTAAR